MEVELVINLILYLFILFNLALNKKNWSKIFQNYSNLI